jgi:hypothetical protein
MYTFFFFGYNIIRRRIYMSKREKTVVVVPEDKMKISSFKSYASSDDDRTRVVDGEKVIEDFHLYEGGAHDHGKKKRRKK